jgi:hypothetical protein
MSVRGLPKKRKGSRDMDWKKVKEKLWCANEETELKLSYVCVFVPPLLLHLTETR